MDQLRKYTPRDCFLNLGLQYLDEVYDEVGGVARVTSIPPEAATWQTSELTVAQALAEYQRMTGRSDLSIQNGIVIFPPWQPK